jgi:hypothetical protein
MEQISQQLRPKGVLQPINTPQKQGQFCRPGLLVGVNQRGQILLVEFDTAFGEIFCSENKRLYVQ